MQASPHLRIAVIGASGSGKTTMARNIAARTGSEYIELDALYWGPGWTATPLELLREQVRAAVEGERWSIDGNYKIVRDIVWPRATTIVWLDFPFWLVAWRVLRRTIRRAVRRMELWNGNRESLRTAFFSRKSILLWMVQTHGKLRREYETVLSQPEYAHLAVIHIQTPRQAREWLASLPRDEE
ncbi:MAG: adenylate kinase [Chloroflexota bacterium]|nr:adenylate kinase [Chloroflexota bacterium]